MTADWVMVFITLIYVVATIIICKANINTSKIANAQLQEMRRQYEAENRPKIEVEFELVNRKFYRVRFINRGRHTAYNTVIDINKDFIDSLPEEQYRELLLKEINRKCVIGVDKYHDIYIGTTKIKDDASVKELTGTIIYEFDGEQYTEDYCIDVANQMTFFSVDTIQDEILDVCKKNNKEMENITAGLEKINKSLAEGK